MQDRPTCLGSDFTTPWIGGVFDNELQPLAAAPVVAPQVTGKMQRLARTIGHQAAERSITRAKRYSWDLAATLILERRPQVICAHLLEGERTMGRQNKARFGIAIAEGASPVERCQ